MLLSASGFSATSAQSGDTFVIRSARVFDGHQVLSQTDVLVEGGNIKSVGKRLSVPADVKSIDATGDTLLPGFIDSHTHAWGNAATLGACA